MCLSCIAQLVNMATVGIYIGLLLFIAMYSAGQSANVHAGGGHPGPGEVGVVDAGLSKLKDHFMASGFVAPPSPPASPPAGTIPRMARPSP